MIQLCELLDDVEPDALWPLVKQCGVDGIVAIMNGAEQQERWLRAREGQAARQPRRGPKPWSRQGLAEMLDRFAAHDLSVAVIEDTPPMNAVRMGLPEAARELEEIHEQITAMGELGVGVLCYNWMIDGWSRTGVAIPARGGALTSGFRYTDAEARGPLIPAGQTSQARLWDALHAFLDATLPVAEAAGVTLSLHPDDPPLGLLRGVPRIVSSPDAYRTIIASHPSPSNKITFCQGNWALMTDDLPATITEFLPHIAFVHFRDVEGTVEDFVETFHDLGPTDLAECMRRYINGGFNGPMRPDHVPTLYGESNDKPGYACLGRLFALGYIRGLMNAVISERGEFATTRSQLG